jgi:hypothetical protein
MRLPHIDQHGRPCTAPLTEMAAVPSSISLFPDLWSCNHISPFTGIVHNLAAETLLTGQVIHCYISPVSLGVIPLGPYGTGLVGSVFGASEELLKQVPRLGAEPQHLNFVAKVSAHLMDDDERHNVRRAMRPGLPFTLVFSSFLLDIALCVRECRLSATVVRALAADFDRHAANPKPGSRTDVERSLNEAIVNLHGRPVMENTLAWEEDVPVIRHPPKRHQGR